MGAGAREQNQCQNDCTDRDQRDAQVAARQAGASAAGGFCLAGSRHPCKATEPPAGEAQSVLLAVGQCGCQAEASLSLPVVSERRRGCQAAYRRVAQLI